jgi:hypothetical protein
MESDGLRVQRYRYRIVIRCSAARIIPVTLAVSPLAHSGAVTLDRVTSTAPASMIKAAISATPWSSLRLLNTNGRVPRMRRASSSITDEACTHQRREVYLVYDQEVGARDTGPAFAWDLVARRDIDDVDRQIGQLRAEGRGQVVTPRFDEDDIEIGKTPAHLGDGGKIGRGILADRRVRAAARLDPDDTLGQQRARSRQELGVLLGVDVVGNYRELEPLAHPLAQAVDQRRLAGTDRTADADTQRTMG